MKAKAQAGLEYLLSYGWALILIATIIGVVIFVVTSPNQNLVFKSSDPTKILLKGAAALGEIVQIKLQNITGGKIRITALTSSDYENITLNGQTLASPVEIGPGGEIIIEATGTTGTITINYTDQAGIPRTATITATGQGGTTTEPEGTPITACGTTISETGTYYLQDNLTTSSGNCITINTDNTTINCNNKTITKTGGQTTNGITINGSNNTVQDCEITGFSSAIEIPQHIPFLQGNTITGSTFTGNTTGVATMTSDNLTITGNNASSNTSYGINVYYSDGATIQNNTCNSNDTGLHLYDLSNSTVSNNTANSGRYGIIFGESIGGNTISGNTARFNSDAFFTGTGIRCLGMHGDVFTGNNASDNQIGMYIESGLGGANTLQGNTFNDNTIGLKINSAFNLVVNSNSICGAMGGGGLMCENSSGFTGTGNFIDNLDPPCDDGWPQLGVNYSNCP